jgi:N-acetylmuramoyl-L-alanine amidase
MATMRTRLPDATGRSNRLDRKLRLAQFAGRLALGLTIGLCCGFTAVARAETDVAAIAVSPQGEEPAATDGHAVGESERAAASELDGNGGTRFSIGLRRAADYKVASLTGPNRIVIDVDSDAVELPQPLGDAPAGLIKLFRSGLSATGTTRVVVEVTAPVVVAHRLVDDTGQSAGQHLVIDLSPLPGEAAAPAAAPAVGTQVIESPPLPRRTTQQAIAGARYYKPTIVLDPGHGGIDSGAQKFGTVEKDVVLAFGHRLKAKLEGTGRYRVLMTRETDVLIELDERRRFAERNDAGLFIAIHADSANTDARGATVYSLKPSVAEDLLHAAKDEARRDLLSRDEVRAISADASQAAAVLGFLSDLAEREIDVNRNRTNIFTRSIIEYLGQSTNLKDNPDRSAQYRVLRTAKMPAVLIELAYVSNEADAVNLRSDTWRDKVTQSIVTAIENYFAQNIASLPL